MSRAILVAGIGFGDEGKGTTVETLTHRHKAKWNVRYNGGHQAAHNIVRDSGAHHTFAQWGSGTFEGAKTYLSEHMLIDPLAMQPEASILYARGGITDVWDRMYVSYNAPIVTPYHRAINRIREKLRGKDAHGSCGLGIGEAAQDLETYTRSWVLKAWHLRDRKLVQERLEYMWELQVEKLFKMQGPAHLGLQEDLQLLATLPSYWVEKYMQVASKIKVVDESIMDEISKSGDVIFEGAQGVLLDEKYGFHPHTTWSNIRYDNALEIIKGTDLEPHRVGVTRSFHTRHGAGPFPTFNRDLNPTKYDKYNGSEGFQGNFRVGYLDFPLLNYAVDVLGGIDSLSVTHLDMPLDKVCIGYEGSDPLWPDHKKYHSLSYMYGTGISLGQSKPVFEELEPVEAIRKYMRVQVPMEVMSFGPTLSKKL